MDLARHQSPNLNLNVYGRSRWDRRSEIVRQIEDEICPSDMAENITGAQPKIAVMGMETEFGNDMKETAPIYNWCEEGD